MGEKILVLGYFGYETNQIDGQTIKTRNFYKLIEKHKREDVEYFDTQKLSTKRFSVFSLFAALFKAKTLVYLPGKSNLKYIFPFIWLISFIKKIKIIYPVVGGWLGEFIQKNPFYKFFLKRISIFLVETPSLVNELNLLGCNAHLFPNFRIHNFSPEIKEFNRDILKLVFVSRISLLKGIDVIFRFAEFLEKTRTHDICIDFYGPIEPESKEYFMNEVDKYSFVKYQGILEPDDVYNTLQEYDILLLPTRYHGEGFPGAIIDAYISGVPVIVSNWKSLPEFVVENETGYVFDLNDEEDLYHKILNLKNNPDYLFKMKSSAHVKSMEYSASNAWILLNNIL